MEKIQTKICSPIRPDFIIGYEEKRLEAKTVRGFDANGQKDRADKTRKSWAPAFPSSTSGYEGERSGQNHWTDMPQGTACSRADISGNGRLACEPEFN